MTSEKAQIQALLHGIDEVLNKTSPRLPWVMSGDAVQQRQVLEQTRQYLVQLQLQLDENPLLLSSPGLNAPTGFPASAPGQSPSESAQQVLQAVLQEMNYWRVNMLQPLRNEIDSLQRQREMLTQELRQLEIQRQQYGLPQQNQKLMMEFLQSAMLQMQANLSAQVSQMVAAAQPQLTQMGDASVGNADRVAQIQSAQAQSDQVMLKLDATVQRIFESLNRNLQTYEASLEQGLQRMHDLGQQGEAMYAFLVNRVAQQMGREASSILQASNQASVDQPTLLSPIADVSPEFMVDDFLSQVPPPAPTAPAPSMPFNLSEEVLDIAALDEAEMAAEAVPLDSNLEALHQELDRLDLALLSPNTPDVTVDRFAADLFSGDQPLSPALGGQPEAATPPAVTDDFDSALDLLNQLSAEMQLDPSLGARLEGSQDSRSAAPDQSAPVEFVSTLDSLYGDDTSLEAAPPPAPTAPVDATTLAEEWFGGLGDPAAQFQPVAESPRSQFSDGSVSQSLEAFLRNDALPSAPETDFVIQEREATAPVEAPETISSFFDLLPETAAPSPELLIQEAAPEVAGVDLGESLQDFQRDFPVAESPAANSVLEGGWEVFSDLPPAASHPASGLPAPSTPQPVAQPPAPVENLDNLFADVPDLNTSAPMPSPAQVLRDLFAQFQPDSADSDPADSEKKN